MGIHKIFCRYGENPLGIRIYAVPVIVLINVLRIVPTKAYIRYSVDTGKIHQVFVYSDVPAIVLTNVLRIVPTKAYIRYSVDTGKIHQVFVYGNVPIAVRRSARYIYLVYY